MESNVDLFLLRWTECPTEENKSSCCPEPMRKENLYTVSLLYIRGFAESITAILFSLTKKENLYTVSLLYIQGFAESCIYNKKTGEQFRSPVSH
jgi:hypothetical protein